MTDTEGPRFDDDRSELLSRMDKWDSWLDSHWSAWRTESRECYEFVAGRQWSADEQSQFEEDHRVAMTVNRIETTIDAVSGAEIMGRQEVTYLPRTVEDTGPTDVLSQGAQYVRQTCDADDEESDAFRDCLICGIGVTETRPDYSEDLDGRIMVERIDPMEVAFDPSSRKANFADARFVRQKIRMSLEEARQTFPQIEDFDSPDTTDARQPTIVDPNVRYKNGDAEITEDEVEVRQYQWFDEEPVTRAWMDGKMVEVPSEAAEIMEQSGIQVVRQKKRVYRRAFRAAGQVFDVEDMEVGEFTFKAITGKRDRNKGTYYGLVRPMLDPQRFANTAASALINNYRDTSKGGIVIEQGAMDDVREFEDSWAQADKITYVRDGALSNPSGARFTAKPVSQMPAALPQILQFSIEGIRDSTGVNLEILGMTNRDQPGVLEQQRKQAAYGILSAFFNAIRRYRKMQGRLLLKEMTLYLPEGTLVRIVGDDGAAKYVPMAYQPDVMKYDVIVDESPTSPNQKERIFAILTQFQGLLGDASPEIIAELIKYSPLPANVSEKLAGMLNKPEPPDPMQQQAQALQMAAAQQDVRKTASEATENEANARLLDAERARDTTEALFNDTAQQALVSTGGL